MTQEQKTKISEHFDELHAIVSDYGLNVPNDIRDALRAAYLAGADYALDIYRPHWISVEDELPKEDGYVIVSCADGVGVWGYDKSYSSQDMKDYNHITHWMPLPQPPHHFADVSQKVKKGGEE